MSLHQLPSTLAEFSLDPFPHGPNLPAALLIVLFIAAMAVEPWKYKRPVRRRKRRG
jgi:hypothetical protein